jgi:hypothetical protein
MGVRVLYGAEPPHPSIFLTAKDRLAVVRTSPEFPTKGEVLMTSSAIRAAAAAAALALGLLGGTPSASADDATALRIAFSGGTPSVSYSVAPGATVSGVLEGVEVDPARCSVANAGGGIGLSACGATDLALDLESNDDGTVTASYRFGPRPGDCVLLCEWRFDPFDGWYLDCLFGASL